MSRVLLGSLGVLAVVAFTLSAQDKGKSKDDEPIKVKEDTLPEQIKRYGEFQRRGCGAKLSISKAELVQAKDERWVVRVHWEIDYTGPRPPLTIFKPSMRLGSKDRTRLGFHHEVAKSGLVRLVHMSNHRQRGPSGVGEEEFATVEKGQNSISGVIDVDTANDETTIPYRDWKRPFYAQLWHSPTERGSEFDLDAWTGQLVSNVIEVTEKKK